MVYFIYLFIILFFFGQSIVKWPTHAREVWVTARLTGQSEFLRGDGYGWTHGWSTRVCCGEKFIGVGVHTTTAAFTDA